MRFCSVSQRGTWHSGPGETAGGRGQPEVQPRVQRCLPDGGSDQRNGRELLWITWRVNSYITITPFALKTLSCSSLCVGPSQGHGELWWTGQGSSETQPAGCSSEVPQRTPPETSPRWSSVWVWHRGGMFCVSPILMSILNILYV